MAKRRLSSLRIHEMGGKAQNLADQLREGTTESKIAQELHGNLQELEIDLVMLEIARLVPEIPD